MTEEEWFTSTDLSALLTEFPHSERKLRLLAIACCHGLNDLLVDDDIRESLAGAELYADGEIRERALELLAQRAKAAVERLEQSGHSLISPQRMAYGLVETTTRTGQYSSGLTDVPGGVSQAFACWTGAFWGTELWEQAQQQASKVLLPLVRDVFGNPVWPAVLDPAWRTSDVLLLARGIYEERAFDRMPILADALQDAGCDSADILDHLRDPDATHVRGCWALDLVLGKE